MTHDRPLHVALSMLTLVPGAMGGSETYARELVRGLGGSTRVEAICVVGPVGAGVLAGLPERVVNGPRGGASSAARVRTLVGTTLHRRRAQKPMAGADVVHYPFTAPVPVAPRGSGTVVSLLDVQHLDLPQLFSKAERAYRRRYYDRAAQQADAVITISDFARRRMIDLLQLDPSRVIVAPLGVRRDDFIFARTGREPFLYYPARAWPHKNHDRLVEAVRLVREVEPAMRLVLTGGGTEVLRARGYPDWVEIRGLVPYDEVLRLYRTAACLVFPSLYEGFGLPPLEAMASGCPVAASQAGPLPEVCGDAAVLFDPEDPVAIAQAVVEALSRSADLADAGARQVERFGWDVCVDRHVAAYELANASR